MKKGFTLIELLAVIAILGLIALVAFPATLSFLNESKEKTDEAKKNIIIQAAKEYVNNNVNYYKRNDSTLNKKIPTSLLIENGYIINKDIIDDDDLKKSWTCVTLNNSKNYTFTYEGQCSDI